MDLEFYLSSANLIAAAKTFESQEKAFDRRVAETTAKRMKNNLALFGQPKD